MSTDPTAEHRDAVAREIAVTIRDGNGKRLTPRSLSLAIARQQATSLLTSTDPAVHAALAASLPAEVMLAALVDRGTLTEERMNKPIFRERTLDPSEVRMVGQNGNATVVYVERWADQCRYVTPWEVAP